MAWLIVLMTAACMPVSAAQPRPEEMRPTPVLTPVLQMTPAPPSPPTPLPTSPPTSLPTPLPTLAAVAQAAPVREIDPRLSSLWFDMSMGSQLVDLFNAYGGTRDIARADHVSLVDLLDKVEAGKRLVIFKNAADVEELMPRLADKLDIIGYNLESGPANRPDEQADPIGSIRRVRAVADQYGKLVAFGPDRAFALNYGAAMAPYADIFVLQVQRAQTEPALVRDFVIPLVTEIRRANPSVQVSVQIRTEGDVVALADLILSLDGYVDGVSILTNDATAKVARDLLAQFRLPLAEMPGPLPTPAAAKPEGRVAVLESPTPGARRNATTSLTAAEMSAPAPATGGIRSLLLLVGLSIMGVILSGLVVTVLLYTYSSWRGR